MKLNLKSIVMGIIIGVTATLGTCAYASNGTMSISATFKNIKIYIDGAELTPRDSAGNILEPFIYNGSTYLPIRAVAEAVGKEVSYDSNTNSVYLGSSGTTATASAQDAALEIQGENDTEAEEAAASTQSAVLEPYQTSTYAKTAEAIMGGVTYKNAVILGSRLSKRGEPAAAYYNLNGQYTSVSGIYGCTDSSSSNNNESAILSFYGDGRLLEEVTVQGGNLPKISH